MESQHQICKVKSEQISIKKSPQSIQSMVKRQFKSQTDLKKHIKKIDQQAQIKQIISKSQQLISQSKQQQQQQDPNQQQKINQQKIVFQKYLSRKDNPGYKKYYMCVDTFHIYSIVLILASFVYRVYLEFDRSQLDENYNTIKKNYRYDYRDSFILKYTIAFKYNYIFQYSMLLTQIYNQVNYHLVRYNFQFQKLRQFRIITNIHIFFLMYIIIAHLIIQTNYEIKLFIPVGLNILVKYKSKGRLMRLAGWIYKVISQSQEQSGSKQTDPKSNL